MKILKIKHKSQKAFTLVELLVCAFLSILIIALLCQTVLVNNRLYKTDIIRTNLNQDLRSAMTILSSSIKEAGENLASSFPAVELTKDEEQGTSRLIIRRNVLEDVLKLCAPINSGETVSRLAFALEGTTSGCIYSDNTYNYTSWKNYRKNNQNIVYPFLYNLEDSEGEFFPYVNEEDTGTEYYLLTNGHKFIHNYSNIASAIYMIEEWEFFVQDGFLGLVENANTDNAKKIINNVSKFDVQIETSDGEIVDTFLPENDDMWSNIKSINVSIENKETFLKEDVKKSLSASFYPRNILSH